MRGVDMGRAVLKLKSLALAAPAAGILIGLGTLTLSASPASATTCAPYSASPCTTPATSPVSTPGLGATDGTPVAASGSSLAFTGSDVEMTATVGAGAIAVGGMIVLASRRRRVQD